MAYAGSFPTLKIDLNMLRGDRIRARRDFTKDSVMPQLKPGDTVCCVEEEGDRYLAIVEDVKGLRVWLRLLLDSCAPAVRIQVRAPR